MNDGLRTQGSFDRDDYVLSVKKKETFFVLRLNWTGGISTEVLNFCHFSLVSKFDLICTDPCMQVNFTLVYVKRKNGKTENHFHKMIYRARTVYLNSYASVIRPN